MVSIYTSGILTPSLESTKTTTSSVLTYAKQMFQTNSNETKILGVPWNKLTEKLSISIPKFQHSVTKRNILSYVASIYDPLGIISPCHVLGKVIFSELCDEKIPWYAKAPECLKNKYVKWVRDTSSLKNEIPRSVALNKESITAVDLYVFGDASAVASFAVFHQPSITNQGLLFSKSRTSKKNLAIPRLELVSAHMVSNLIENVKAALKRCNIRSVTGWTDSTVVLHWLNRQGLCNF